MSEAHALINATMLELGVLGVLILVMVVSIAILRYSGGTPRPKVAE